MTLTEKHNKTATFESKQERCNVSLTNFIPTTIPCILLTHTGFVSKKWVKLHKLATLANLYIIHRVLHVNYIITWREIQREQNCLWVTPLFIIRNIFLIIIIQKSWHISSMHYPLAEFGEQTSPCQLKKWWTAVNAQHNMYILIQTAGLTIGRYAKFYKLFWNNTVWNVLDA